MPNYRVGQYFSQHNFHYVDFYCEEYQEVLPPAAAQHPSPLPQQQAKEQAAVEEKRQRNRG